MNKLIASGIVVIGWGLLIVGLVGCSTASPTQIPTQAPAAQASVTASPQASNGSVAQAPSQATATKASVAAPTQASSGSVTQGPTQASATQATKGASPQGSADGESPLDTLDPCTVATQDDATAFFGVPSVPGMPSKGSPVAFCIYASADNTAHLSLNLRYYAQGGVNYDDYVQLKSLSQNVTGLGDGAFYSPVTHILTIAKGPWIVMLSGNIPGVDSTLEKLKALAPKVLGRLP